jgi:diacylglycerol kinase (ATP)
MAVQALRSAGVPVRLVLPSSAEESARVASQARDAGARAVVACGGDGTVHAVLQSMVGAEVPMAVLAGGSGDDVAAGLGYATGGDAEVVAALVATIVGGRTRQVDIARATAADGVSHAFLGVMSTGFDSSVNERANRMPRLAGQRYNVAMLRELASFRPLDYEVLVDGRPVTGPGMLVSVGNGPRFGGGMLVCPDARPDDGLLDVTWLGAIPTASFLRLFPRVYRGTHVAHPAVTTYRAQALTIHAEGQVAYADGERIGPLPVQVTVEPGALRVLASRSGPEAVA